MQLGINNRIKQLTIPIIWLYLLLIQIFMHISLCFTLTIKLYDILKRGSSTWIVMLSKLMSFTILLSPGWYKLINYYLFDKHVIRNIPYSDSKPTSRNLLDIYLPLNSMKDENKTKRYPVILFVSGGAWVIGYKMWSALIARGLSRLGAIVVCPDYRNAPQGDIECMMDDITNAIKWTINNIDKYNGDRNNIIVAGQSAGAHISMCLLIDSYDRMCNNSECISPYELTPKSSSFHEYYHKNKEIKDSNGNRNSFMYRNRLNSYEFSCISLVVGVSGPYNLFSLSNHLHTRGLDNSLLKWICNNDINRYSPTIQLRHINERVANKRIYFNKFPKIILYHGSNDCTVPCSNTIELADEFTKAGADIDITIYEGYSHTDPILEGPLMGENRLLHDMMRVIRNNDCDIDSDHDIDKPLVPKWLVQAAKRINPF